jgi:vacuolar-type H+-ATPase subunit H
MPGQRFARMTDNVDDLLRELRRKNHEKKRRVLASGEKTAREHKAKASAGKDRKAAKLIDEETAARSVVIREYRDLHEVASRVKGKK